MKKAKFIIIIANTAICILLLISVVYSWYTKTQQASDMSFDILQIDSLVTMYKGNDSNFNGVPDLLADENVDKYYKTPDGTTETEYIEYSNQYHHETYSFDYHDQKYALSTDSVANLFNTFTITNAAPSKVYSYKFEVTNYIGSKNTLNFTFDKESGVTYDVDKLSCFEVRLGAVDADNNVTFTSWTSFVTDSTYSGFELDPITTDDTTGLIIPAFSTEIETSKTINGRLDLWLQIRMKSDVTTTFDSYELPKFRIQLTAEITDPT